MEDFGLMEEILESKRRKPNFPEIDEDDIIDCVDDDELFVTLLGAVEHGDLESLKLIKAAESTAFSNYLKTQGGRLICEAVRWRHYESANFLLCNGCSIKRQNSMTTTAFHLAAADSRSGEFLERLTMYHQDLSIRDAEDNTPLHSACLTGANDNVDILIRNGAFCDDCNKHGQTPLHLAALHGNSEGVALLLKHGAAVNLRDTNGPLGKTALDYAVQSLFELLGCDNLLKGIKALLEWKSSQADHILQQLESLHVIQEHRESLSSTFSSDHQDMISHVKNLLKTIDILIQNGGTFNIIILCAKHFLCADRLMDVVEKLVGNDCKLDVNVRDDWLYTPLHIVVFRFPSQIVERFIEFGADVNAEALNGETPLQVALQRQESIDTVKLLIRNGANVNFMSPQGWSPLLFALAYLDLVVVELLLESGADPNTRELSESGWTPLMRMVKSPPQYYVKTIKCLLKYGADVTIRDTSPAGLTPLHMAAMCPRREDIQGREIVRLMIEHVKDVNLLDNSRCTPLLRAVTVQYASIPIIKLLLDSGANPNLCGVGEYDSPLKAAIHSSKNEVINILLEYETFIHPDELFKNRDILLNVIAINKPYNRAELFEASKFINEEHLELRNNHIQEYLREKHLDYDEGFSFNFSVTLYEMLKGCAEERSSVSAQTSGCAVLFCDAEYFVLGTKSLKDVDESVLRGVLEYRLEINENDSYKAACARELECMKATEVSDEFTVFDLLHCDVCTILQRLRRASIFDGLVEKVDAVVDELRFPIYGTTVRRRVRYIVGRRHLLYAAVYFTRSLDPESSLSQLPLDVFEFILNNLSNADLVNWIFYVTNVEQSLIDELLVTWIIKFGQLVTADEFKNIE